MNEEIETIEVGEPCKWLSLIIRHSEEDMIVFAQCLKHNLKNIGPNVCPNCKDREEEG